MTVQARLKRIENELKALKAYSQPSLGQLRFPEDAPSVSYRGNLDTSISNQNLVIARLVATFTRTDNATITPLVEFAFSAGVSPTHAEVIQAEGGSISGNDLTAYEDVYINGYISATTDKAVEFTIDVKNAVAPWGSSPKTLSARVVAYSTVEGIITIKRVV